jgi:hypothetical protein
VKAFLQKCAYFTNLLTQRELKSRFENIRERVLIKLQLFVITELVKHVKFQNEPFLIAPE